MKVLYSIKYLNNTPFYKKLMMRLNAEETEKSKANFLKSSLNLKLFSFCHLFLNGCSEWIVRYKS